MANDTDTPSSHAETDKPPSSPSKDTGGTLATLIQVTPRWLLLAVLLALVAMIGYGILDNRDVDLWPPKIHAKTQTVPSHTPTKETARPATSPCEAAAIRDNRKYVIESAIMFVDPELVGRTLQVDLRTVYHLKALTDIAKNDPAFIEEYTYRYAQDFQPWFGTEKMIHTDGNNYQVVLEMKKGDERTIVTGGRFLYRWPLPTRKFFNDLMTFGPSDYAAMYPNKDPDAICELDLIASSSTLDLHPADESAITLNEKSQIVSALDPNQTPPSEAVLPSQRSISYRWKDVVARQTKIIKFSMTPVRR